MVQEKLESLSESSRDHVASTLDNMNASTDTTTISTSNITSSTQTLTGKRIKRIALNSSVIKKKT